MTVVNRGGADIAEPFHSLWHFHAELGLEDCTWEEDPHPSPPPGRGRGESFGCVSNELGLVV